MIKGLSKTVMIKNDGPCSKALESVLQEAHVQRQAYYGKCFVGNHVQKMLKVYKLKILFSKHNV